MKTGFVIWPTLGRRSLSGSRTITKHGHTRRLAIGPRKSSQKRRRRAVEKTVAPPPWKTLRVSHFSPATTAARASLPCPFWSSKTRRKSHYLWTKNGGQVRGLLGFDSCTKFGDPDCLVLRGALQEDFTIFRYVVRSGAIRPAWAILFSRRVSTLAGTYFMDQT